MFDSEIKPGQELIHGKLWAKRGMIHFKHTSNVPFRLWVDWSDSLSDFFVQLESLLQICWVIFRVRWGLMFRVGGYSWGLIFSGEEWYAAGLTKYENICPCRCPKNVHSMKCRPSQHPPAPLKALMPWHSVRNFSAWKCFVFFHGDDQKQMHRTENPGLENSLHNTHSYRWETTWVKMGLWVFGWEGSGVRPGRS